MTGKTIALMTGIIFIAFFAACSSNSDSITFTGSKETEFINYIRDSLSRLSEHPEINEISCGNSFGFQKADLSGSDNYFLWRSPKKGIHMMRLITANRENPGKLIIEFENETLSCSEQEFANLVKTELKTDFSLTNYKEHNSTQTALVPVSYINLFNFKIVLSSRGKIVTSLTVYETKWHPEWVIP